MTREEAEKKMLGQISDAHAYAENGDFDAAASWAEAALETWREYLPEEGDGR